MKRLTPDKEKRIGEMLATGHSLMDIQRETGAALPTIAKRRDAMRDKERVNKDAADLPPPYNSESPEQLRARHRELSTRIDASSDEAECVRLGRELMAISQQLGAINRDRSPGLMVGARPPEPRPPAPAAVRAAEAEAARRFGLEDPDPDDEADEDEDEGPEEYEDPPPKPVAPAPPKAPWIPNTPAATPPPVPAAPPPTNSAAWIKRLNEWIKAAREDIAAMERVIAYVQAEDARTRF